MGLTTIVSAVLALLAVGVYSDPYCADGSTLVESRWFFNHEGITCVDLTAKTVDFYDLQNRAECAYALSEDIPHITEAYQVFECHQMANGTLKYNNKICCQGTKPSCHQCDLQSFPSEPLSGFVYFPKCNWDSGPAQVCNAGDSCLTQIDYGTISDNRRRVAKRCIPTVECDALLAADTCKNGIHPKCNFCCQGSLCNNRIENIPNMKPQSANKCDLNRCKNGALCVLDPSNKNGFICKCTALWKGALCKTYKPCKPNPCKNRGECLYAPDGNFLCKCHVSWGGPTCSDRYEMCAVNSCFNGGSCYVQRDNKIRCDCPPGYAGENCGLFRPKACNSNIVSVTLDRKLVQDGNSDSAKDCNDIDVISQKSVKFGYYYNSCQRKLRTAAGLPAKSTYKAGVDGEKVDGVMSVSLAACDHGDDYIYYKDKVCCPSCLSSPCMNNGKCESTEYGFKCNCQTGWSGERCGKKIKLCYGTGDPHYSTFDGELIHYQGVCKLDMASPVSREAAEDLGLQYFQVFTKNEHRHGSTAVSYPRYVELTVYGHVIRVGKNKLTKVDGVQVFPYYQGSGFDIRMEGDFVYISTDFGLSVQSDGGNINTVTLPEEYSGIMGGICADANNMPDNDFRSKNGNDETNNPMRDSVIGNSWKVPDPEDPGCFDPNVLPPPECEDEDVVEASQNHQCGTIKDLSSSFAACIASFMMNSNQFYENCQYDFCANKGNPKAQNSSTCAAVKAFAIFCENKDFPVPDYAVISSCESTCSPDTMYQGASEQCVPTCSNFELQESCFSEDVECRCSNPGHVIIDGLCKPISECPCMFNDGDVPVSVAVGDSYVTSDCTTEIKCALCSTAVGDECPRPAPTVSELDLGSCPNCVLDPDTNQHTCKESCSPTELYAKSGPECIPTCDNPVVNVSCSSTYSESCPCENQGDVVKDGQCVPFEQCKCTDSQGKTTLPGDAQYLSSNCSELLTCVSEGGNIQLLSEPAIPCKTCEVDANGTAVCDEIADRCTMETGLCGMGFVCVNLPNFMFSCAPITDGGWSEWSHYGHCDKPCGERNGHGKQYRYRQCSSPAPSNGGADCPQSDESRQGRTCSCDPDAIIADEDCVRCKYTTNGIGYLEDSCDCTRYYVCQKLEEGRYKVHSKKCSPCTVWSGEMKTCIFDDTCVLTKNQAQTTTVEYECQYEAVPGNPGVYMKGKLQRDCPPGTVYNSDACWCIVGTTASTTTLHTSELPKEKTCLNFDRGWNGFVGSNHAYFTPNKVQRVIETPSRGHSGYFNGATRLEYWQFNNAYSRLGSITISLWYKREGYDTANQGLFDNSNCVSNPSLLASSGVNSVETKLVTNKAALNNLEAKPEVWNHLVLTYDGKMVNTYLNGVKSSNGPLDGNLMNSECPLVFGHSANSGGYFKGYMDDICIYDKGLTASQVNTLYQDGNV